MDATLIEFAWNEISYKVLVYIEALLTASLTTSHTKQSKKSQGGCSQLIINCEQSETGQNKSRKLFAVSNCEQGFNPVWPGIPLLQLS